MLEDTFSLTRLLVVLLCTAATQLSLNESACCLKTLAISKFVPLVCPTPMWPPLGYPQETCPRNALRQGTRSTVATIQIVLVTQDQGGSTNSIHKVDRFLIQGMIGMCSVQSSVSGQHCTVSCCRSISSNIALSAELALRYTATGVASAVQINNSGIILYTIQYRKS